MLGLLRNSHKKKEFSLFGPFGCVTQKRWRKPTDSAQTRLETRTRDLKLDKLADQIGNLAKILKLQELMSKAHNGYTSVQIISRWRNIVGINTGIGDFLRKYPRVFDVFTHPIRRNVCCRVTREMSELVSEEARIVGECEPEVVRRLKKLIMMSRDGTLHIHALWLVRRELGLPDEFRDSILLRYPDEFRVIYPDTLALVERGEGLAEAEVEKWREKEYREKWLSEFETKYAFPIRFPTGFKIERGFREKMKNWQRLPYVKPYERTEAIRVRTCGGVERFEKHAVGVLHEFLSLTVEKMVEVERLSHFRRDFDMEVNVRELLLKHPGIFYISTKGENQTLFLREAYSKGCLIEPNPVYAVRRRMLDLMLLGSRSAGRVQPLEGSGEDNVVIDNNLVDASCDGDWGAPILQGYDDQLIDSSNSNSRDTCREETSNKLILWR